MTAVTINVPIIKRESLYKILFPKSTLFFTQHRAVSTRTGQEKTNIRNKTDKTVIAAILIPKDVPNEYANGIMMAQVTPLLIKFVTSILAHRIKT
jgi:hypothetical protein